MKRDLLLKTCLCAHVHADMRGYCAYTGFFCQLLVNIESTGLYNSSATQFKRHRGTMDQREICFG